MYMCVCVCVCVCVYVCVKAEWQLPVKNLHLFWMIHILKYTYKLMGYVQFKFLFQTARCWEDGDTVTWSMVSANGMGAIRSPSL
jgi:hypothetical protein